MQDSTWEHPIYTAQRRQSLNCKPFNGILDWKRILHSSVLFGLPTGYKKLSWRGYKLNNIKKLRSLCSVFNELIAKWCPTQQKPNMGSSMWNGGIEGVNHSVLTTTNNYIWSHEIWLDAFFSGTADYHHLNTHYPFLALLQGKQICLKLKTSLRNHF